MDLARAMQPLAYVLAPFLLYQGQALRRRIPRLPEAADPAGTAGDGSPPIRLAVFGDSTASGVDGFHPSSNGYRAWAGELAGPVARAVMS